MIPGTADRQSIEWFCQSRRRILRMFCTTCPSSFIIEISIYLASLLRVFLMILIFPDPHPYNSILDRQASTAIFVFHVFSPTPTLALYCPCLFMIRESSFLRHKPCPLNLSYRARSTHLSLYHPHSALHTIKSCSLSISIHPGNSIHTLGFLERPF